MRAQVLADRLEAFEGANREWLASREVGNWNTWYAIKKPLYFFLKQRGATPGGGSSGSHTPNGRNYWLREAPRFFVRLARLLVSKRGADWIVTDTSNKLERDAGGRYLDPFVDPLVLSGIVRNYIYIESSNNYRFKQPSAVRRHLNRDVTNVAMALLGKVEKLPPGFWSAVNELHERFNLFFAETPEMNVSADSLADLLKKFWWQYRWNLLLIGRLKPARIFTVDAISDGLLAAARERSIPVYEFQHGFITRNRMDYIVDPVFSAKRARLAIPAGIMVFGNYFKRLLLKSGFWNDREIVVIGSAVVEAARRETVFALPAGTVSVLLTTQPSMYRETTDFLEGLAKAMPPGVTVTFRLHPLEPAAQRAWYESVAAANTAFSIDSSPTFFSALRDRHMVVSYFSTTLLEALAIGIPAVSLSTGAFRNGLNDLLDTPVTGAVRNIRTPQEFSELAAQMLTDHAFCRQWHENALVCGRDFFADEYEGRLKAAFPESSKNKRI
jgi:glycosyltransferase involved in cell wall biosynthesis